jgi:subtilisin-like proprotein convertase family protein
VTSKERKMKLNIYKLFFISIFVILLFNEKIPALMFWNNACSFAGASTSFINRGNSTSLNITGSFTLEAWLNPNNSTSPTSQIILQKREGGNAVGYTLYLNNGKVTIRTNSATRLVGKTVLQNNAWTHVAGTYNSATGQFAIYINGSFDTTTTIAGAAPASNTDSLFIGKGFNDPFRGQMDELRVWNRNLSASEVNQYRRTSLGTNTGVYIGLIMSMTFQDNDANGAAFNLTDWSGNNNNGINRGVTAVDLSNRPLQTISINDCVELNGSDEYLAAPDNAAFSPASELTLEAWIFPRSFDKKNVIIHKGTADGVETDYNLILLDGRLHATINNLSKYYSNVLIPLNQWSHVTFNYDGPNGFYTFYLNGEVISTSINDKGFIIDGTDSLYIGGTIGLTDFDGYLDEVRVTTNSKYSNEINNYLFKSIDESNDGPSVEAVYNFDGYLVSNVGSFNRLYFRNGANFSHSGAINNKALSPLNRADALSFPDGFYLKTSNRRIPESGTSGLMDNDTLNVMLNEIITDVNVFVATNHTAEQNLTITLTAPNGESVTMLNSNSLVVNSDNMITIFNDDADSTIVNGRYVSFAPVIKPVNNLNTLFAGDSTLGRWSLVINDLTAADTGRLYGWGIQFNNMTSKPLLLSTKALIQGFYNASADVMIRDTMRIYLREIVFPFPIRDTSMAYLNANGSAIMTFDNTNLLKDVHLLMQLHHRNSIETWSAHAIVFHPLTSQAEYNFTTASTQAFGGNMIQVDNSPLRFAIYGGDVDQNGNVDASDLSSIDNDAFNFVTGYVLTDITGDEVVDASDASIADNNAFNFVSRIIP